MKVQTLTLSIHVDGYYGLTEGVPKLLNLFEQNGIKATFFVNMGREASIFSLLEYFRKNKEEFKKTKRTINRYNKIQMLSTILLMRKLGCGHKEILKEIEKKGHRVEPHCWSHLEWSKNFENLDYKKQIYLFKKSFKECLGKDPQSFAPPTWKINREIVRELERNGFQEVCLLKKDANMTKHFKVIKPNLLTFEKTIEELLQEGKDETEILEIYKEEIKRKNAHVYFHADFEGIKGIKIFEKVLKIINSRNISLSAEL